ncbi:hypothetical protein IWW50_005714, partial [Coemansia erecta]
MDKISEFNAGLQTLLDSPSPPHDELRRVITTTDRDFLASALSTSTLTWPTRTHLELVKVAISQPLAAPAHALIVSDPTNSHEHEPFFAAAYFDKLRERLLAMSVGELAESDGSWVRNVGFSVEATIMQAVQRMDALARLDSEQAQGGDGSRVRVYCTHVLGSGTLAADVWQALARVVFAMFHVLPCTTRVLADTDAAMDARSGR